MTREETKECIKVMQRYVDGGMVGHHRKDEYGKSYFVESKDPAWNWFHETYIARPKSIKVTEEEKELMSNKRIFWAKNKNTGTVDCYFNHVLHYFNDAYFILNPETMEWEDRSVR